MAVGDVLATGAADGMFIIELQARCPTFLYFDAVFAGPYPAQPPVSMDGNLSDRRFAACKADPAGKDEVPAPPPWSFSRDALPSRAVAVSSTFPIAGVQREFASLGVTFDLRKEESTSIR